MICNLIFRLASFSASSDAMNSSRRRRYSLNRSLSRSSCASAAGTNSASSPPASTKSPALRLDLGAVRLVEGYLDGFHHPAQRLHRLLVEHLGEQGDHLLLAPAVEKRIRRSGRTFVHRFTVCRLLLVEPRAPRGQCSLLVREIDPLGRCGDRFPGRRYGRNSRLRLFHRCGPDRLLRRSGSLHGGSAAVSPTAAATGSPAGSSAGTATVTSSAAGASEADVFCTSSALLTCSSGTEGLVILVAILR